MVQHILSGKISRADSSTLLPCLNHDNALTDLYNIERAYDNNYVTDKNV